MIPLYSDKLIRHYIKTWPSYTGADWDEFKDALLDNSKMMMRNKRETRKHTSSVYRTDPNPDLAWCDDRSL